MLENILVSEHAAATCHKSGVTYSVPCACETTYIEETGRKVCM